FPFCIHIDGCLIENGGSHLTGDKTHPDQTVKLHLIVSEILLQGFRSTHGAGGTNRFMGVLSRLFGLIEIWRGRNILSSVALSNKLTNFTQCLIRNTGGVSTHISDETDGTFFFSKFHTFIKALCQTHRSFYRKSQLSGGFL